MKMERKNLLFMFGMIFLVACGIVLGIAVTNIYNITKSNSFFSEQINDSNLCSNLDIVDTSNCLRDYVSTFYNYTIRTDIVRTLEDIKQNGGDCYDYSNLYKKFAQELGFESKLVGLPTHTFIIMYDKTGYCKLDQIALPNCFTYGEALKNEK